MTARYWTGKAEAVAQIATVQITAFDATTTYTLTINGIAVSVVGVTDADTTATNLAAAWEASSHPYFAAVAAVAATDTITLTGTAGSPFTATSSKTGGTGTIGSVTVTTAATGPYHWGNVDNWSGATLPVNGDDVTIDLSDARILYDLDQSSLQLDSLKLRRDGKVGLFANQFATSADGDTTDASAPEYRDTFLQAEIAILEIGQLVGAAVFASTARCNIDNTRTAAGTVQTVYSSAQTASDTGKPAIQLSAGSANVDTFIRKAIAGIGFGVDAPDDTLTVGDINVDDSTQATRLYVGRGATLSKLSMRGGRNLLESAATVATVEVSGGQLTVEGDQLITAMIVTGGDVKLHNAPASGDAITTLTQSDGEVSFWGSSTPRSVGTYNFNGGARQIDDYITIGTDSRSGRVTERVD